jgi:hypothetical protein
MLWQLIKERQREEFVLNNGITLEARAPTLRGVAWHHMRCGYL